MSCLDCYVKQNTIRISVYLSCPKCGNIAEHKTKILNNIHNETSVTCWNCINKAKGIRNDVGIKC